jgi:methyl-accepting chemotaxis protein
MRDITRQIDEHQGAVAAAVQEQTATTTEMSRTLAVAAEGSRAIAETVADVAGAAGRTTDAAEHTAQAASSVTEVGDRLRAQVLAFEH